MAPITDGTGVASTKRLSYFNPEAAPPEFNVAYASGVWSEDNFFQPYLGKSSISFSTFNIPYPNTTEFGPDTTFDQNITWPVYSWYNNTSFQEVLHGNFDNYTFAGIHNPLSVFGFAKLEYDARFFNSSNPSKGFKVEMATECSLSLCVSDWKVSVQKGNTQIDTSNIDYGYSFVKNNVTLGHEVNWLCWRPTFSPPSIAFQDNFAISPVDFTYCGISGVTELPQDILKGSSPVSYELENGKGTFNYQVGNTGAASTQRISNTGIEHVMSNIANSLNKMVLIRDGEDVNGTAYGMEVFIVVQWPWLILPGVLVISGVSFFFLALISNERIVLWKSSVFAFLYHGLVEIDIDNGITASGMEKEAIGEWVQLRASCDDDGATSATQRDPARPQRLNFVRCTPPDSDCKTKAMKSSSSRPMQEFEQSLRTILHAHAATAAGAASLCGCLFAGNQQLSVVSKIAGRGDPQAHNLRGPCRVPFKRGEEWPRLKNSAKWHKTYQFCETPRNSLIVSNRHHGTMRD
ncbi:hypothetical protein MYU51_000707 [Penicillium brevicompactum]